MTRCRTLLLLAVVFLAGCKSDSNHPAPLRPNVIYILADDLGYGDLGCYNADSGIRTPRLDQLAKEGMLFTDMHSPSSVCTPTRYGILTGEYCWRSRLPLGVLRGYGRTFLEEDRITVAHMLKEVGYQTAVVGKWHLGLDWKLTADIDSVLEMETTSKNEFGVVTEMDPDLIDFDQPVTGGPKAFGFDYSYVLPASLDMDPYCYLENNHLLEVPDQHTPGNDLETGYTGAFWRAGRIAPGFSFDQVLPNFIDKAIAFLQRAVPIEKPFFLYLPLAAPHTPWVPTSAFVGSSEIGSYGEFVQQVDSEVGRVLDALTNLDREDETIVIFTSDNGPFWTPALIEQYGHRAAAQLRGMKADAFEGGHRIPHIIKWPGHIEAGTRSDVISCLTHLPATLSEIIDYDIDQSQTTDSYSIWSALQGSTEATQDHVIHHSSRGFFAIRKGDWKLIDGLGSGGFSQPSIIDQIKGGPRAQLYNLKEDEGEQTDLVLEELARADSLLLQLEVSQSR